MSASNTPLIQVRDVVIGIPHKRRPTLTIVNKANFDINYGEMVGIVGESGSGKTMICRTMIGTLERRGGKILSGDVLFEGESLARASESDWKKLRGNPLVTSHRARSLVQIQYSPSKRNLLRLFEILVTQKTSSRVQRNFSSW